LWPPAAGATTVRGFRTDAVVPTGGTFTLTSPAGVDGGTLPSEYTCDGAGSTIALSWSNAPSGTREFA